MQVTRGLTAFTPPPQGLALTIGNFDGVHLGHRRLIEVARQAGRRTGASVAVITFEPHPAAILAPHRAPERLTRLPEKLELLERAGVEHAIVLETNRGLLEQTAEAFLDALVTRCRPRAIVEGPTFNFGRDRTGSVDTLRAFAGEYEYEFHLVEEFFCETGRGRTAVNSSAIRSALRDGAVEDARAMLGRPYGVRGEVRGGDGRGAPLGFPTANLDGIATQVPGFGVYAGLAQLADGRCFLAAVNIGPQPTFDQGMPRVEAHLLDFDEALLGHRLAVYLLNRLRGQVRFPDVDALRAQLTADVATVRTFADEVTELAGTLPPPVPG